MSTAELLISQAPLYQEYFEAAKTHWQASRHPQVIAEVIDTAKAEDPDLTRGDKWGLGGTIGITLVQQLPFNEMAVGWAVGTALALTDGNVPLAVAAAGVVTGSAEIASGVGTAHAVEKFPAAMRIMSEQYVNHDKIAARAAAREAKGKKPESELGRIYGIGSLALTSGVTLYEALRDRTRSLQDNLRTAKIATGMVAFNYMFVTGVVVGTAEGAEAMGAEEATERLQSTIRNPLIMGSVVGLIVGGAKLKKYVQTRKGLRTRKAAEAAASEQGETLAVAREVA